KRQRSLGDYFADASGSDGNLGSDLRLQTLSGVSLTHRDFKHSRTRNQRNQFTRLRLAVGPNATPDLLVPDVDRNRARFPGGQRFRRNVTDEIAELIDEDDLAAYALLRDDRAGLFETYPVAHRQAELPVIQPPAQMAGHGSEDVAAVEGVAHR